MLLTALLGYWRVDDEPDRATRPGCHFGIPICCCVMSVWVAYRLVNLPAFADFLIAVEAEMNKVSWPTRHELFRASVVVLFTIFVLAGVLYFFDAFWQWFFSILHIIS